MEQSVIDQISTVLKKAGYIKTKPITPIPKSRNDQEFPLILPDVVVETFTYVVSNKSKYVFERSDNLWVVMGKDKQECGRFMSEEWALKWVDILIHSTN